MTQHIYIENHAVLEKLSLVKKVSVTSVIHYSAVGVTEGCVV